MWGFVEELNKCTAIGSSTQRGFSRICTGKTPYFFGENPATFVYSSKSSFIEEGNNCLFLEKWRFDEGDYEGGAL
jgi:hypothetical protein